jgi:hypothetical protein
MAAYDALPPDVRRSIGQASLCYSAKQVADLVERNGKAWVLHNINAIEINRLRIRDW